MNIKILYVVIVMDKQCWSQAVLESGSWGHSVLQTPAAVLPSVRPSSVHLSVMLSPKPLSGIQQNLLHHFPSWYGCARATLFYRASVIRPSVRHAISS